MLTSPAVPSLDEPVSSTTAPLLPPLAVAEPDESCTSPLLAPLPEPTVTDPLAELSLLPLNTLRAPPSPSLPEPPDISRAPPTLPEPAARDTPPPVAPGAVVSPAVKAT
jgi:hypothetical protein|tara:strand:+ start:355 stop:681 length:327 start_codon:yes stop_codon:yes gene_type:complete